LNAEMTEPLAAGLRYAIVTMAATADISRDQVLIYGPCSVQQGMVHGEMVSAMLQNQLRKLLSAGEIRTVSTVNIEAGLYENKIKLLLQELPVDAEKISGGLQYRKSAFQKIDAGNPVDPDLFNGFLLGKSKHIGGDHGYLIALFDELSGKIICIAFYTAQIWKEICNKDTVLHDCGTFLTTKCECGEKIGEGKLFSD